MVMKSIDGNVVDWIRQRFTLPHFRSCRRLVVWAHGTLVGIVYVPPVKRRALCAFTHAQIFILKLGCNPTTLRM